MKYQIEQLEKENRKLKEDNRFLTKISKEYMEKENIIQVTEFTELYKDDLKEENKKLKEDLENMRDYCSNLDSENDEQALEIEDLKREVEKLKEIIKDHQLYEEKLEHTIIEFEELLH